MSDRYQLHRSIVYAKAVMIGTEALVRMQTHATHLALKLRPLPLELASTAVHAYVLARHALRPMANKASVCNCWGGWMHVSMLGWIDGRYLLQQLFAEVKQARLLVVVHAPQLVCITDARIE